MTEQPTLHTERLILRPFAAGDAEEVERLAGERVIAETTLMIPHPYPPGAAASWIAEHPERFRRGEAVTFAVTLRRDGSLLGAVGLTIETPHARGEIGYWMARPAWNRGYATEASRAALAYGFDTLRLNRICAHHFSRNPASGRVMEKIGMQYEGELRQHIRKWGRFEDLRQYGILRAEYDDRRTALGRSGSARDGRPDPTTAESPSEHERARP